MRPGERNSAGGGGSDMKWLLRLMMRPIEDLPIWLGLILGITTSIFVLYLLELIRDGHIRSLTVFLMFGFVLGLVSLLEYLTRGRL